MRPLFLFYNLYVNVKSIISLFFYISKEKTLSVAADSVYSLFFNKILFCTGFVSKSIIIFYFLVVNVIIMWLVCLHQQQKGGEDIEKDTGTGDNCNNFFTFIKKCLLIGVLCD